jgi:hypothetical protein
MQNFKRAITILLASVSIVTMNGINPAHSEGVVYGEFNDSTMFKEWQKLKAVTSDSPTEVLKTKLNVIDLLFGNAEGNIEYNRENGQWEINEDFWFHMEPGQSKRKQDNLGLVNAGIASVSCFKDRPTDQVVNQLCVNVLKKEGLTLATFAKLPQAQRIEVYKKMKMAIYLSLQYQAGLRNNSKPMIAELDSLKIKRQTSTDLFFIDQTNQLGLGGAKQLAKIYKSLEKLNHKQLLARIRTYGIMTQDGIFTGGYGQKIDLNPIPDSQLRAALSRVLWHNTRGTATTFISGHPWLNDVSRKWSYNTVLKDYPDLKAEIKTYITETFGNIDQDKLKYSAVGQGEDKFIVQVFDGKKVLFAKVVMAGVNSHYFTDQKVAFADTLRRITTLPQSQIEYNDMKAASTEFLTEQFYSQIK